MCSAHFLSVVWLFFLSLSFYLSLPMTLSLLHSTSASQNAAKRREHEANRRARERAANDERRLERAEERRERELFAAAEARAQELAAAVTEKERALAQQGAEHAEELDRLRAQIAAARIAAPVASRTSVALALQRELHATGLSVQLARFSPRFTQKYTVFQPIFHEKSGQL